MITLPHDWEAALTRFVDWLLLLGRSPRTVQLYTGALRRFAQFGGLPGHLDQVQLTRFLRDRRAAVSATAVNLDVQALRAYGRCLRAHGESSGWMVIKRQRAPPARLPQPVNVATLLAQIRLLLLSERFGAIRDAVLLWIGLECGLLPSECARLTIGSVLDGELHVPAPRRGSGRYVPLSAPLAAAIECYLDARANRQRGKGDHLWLRSNGRALRGAQSISARCTAHGYTPRQLRDTCAHATLADGAPVTYVAQLLGYASLASIDRHLAGQIEALRAAVALLRQNGGSSDRLPAPSMKKSTA